MPNARTMELFGAGDRAGCAAGTPDYPHTVLYLTA
jgi:hypothetical protein